MANLPMSLKSLTKSRERVFFTPCHCRPHHTEHPHPTHLIYRTPPTHKGSNRPQRHGRRREQRPTDATARGGLSSPSPSHAAKPREGALGHGGARRPGLSIGAEPAQRGECVGRGAAQRERAWGETRKKTTSPSIITPTMTPTPHKPIPPHPATVLADPAGAAHGTAQPGPGRGGQRHAQDVARVQLPGGRDGTHPPGPATRAPSVQGLGGGGGGRDGPRRHPRNLLLRPLSPRAALSTSIRAPTASQQPKGAGGGGQQGRGRGKRGDGQGRAGEVEPGEGDAAGADGAAGGAGGHAQGQ